MTANLFFDNSRELWWKRMILDTHWCAPITFTWLEFTSLEIQYIDNLLFILGRKKSRNCGKSFNYFHLLIQQPLFDVILMNVCKVLRSEIVLNILFFSLIILTAACLCLSSSFRKEKTHKKFTLVNICKETVNEYVRSTSFEISMKSV